MKNKTWIALLTLLLALPASAQDLVVDGFAGFNRIPYQQVSIELSEPGESMDDFVLRVAPVFDQFTAQHEWEACGRLAQATEGEYAGRYALVIGTLQAAQAGQADHVPWKVLGSMPTNHAAAAANAVAMTQRPEFRPSSRYRSTRAWDHPRTVPSAAPASTIAPMTSCGVSSRRRPPTSAGKQNPTSSPDDTDTIHARIRPRWGVRPGDTRGAGAPVMPRRYVAAALTVPGGRPLGR